MRSLPQALKALGAFRRLCKRFGTDRIMADLPHLRDRMERFDGLATPQQTGVQRYDLINAAIDRRGYKTYLEIGVRNPADCFDRISAPRKWSVDPGIEFKRNPVDFPLTSDRFFELCSLNRPDSCPAKWDVIFIDGLHRAEQVWRDIEGALANLSEGGMVFLHDCFPPSEVFARERFEWALESRFCWNGTSWKALARYLESGRFDAFVIDADWGVGVIDSRRAAAAADRPRRNDFFEHDLYVEGLRAAGRLRSPEQFRSLL